MMEVLQQYGREFLIFEPEDQSNVFAVPGPEYRALRNGNLDPREMRSWRFLDFTFEFLWEHYRTFPTRHFVIDCPVHEHAPLKEEEPKDFRKCFQLSAEGTIKFRCRRSVRRKRERCAVKNNRSPDLYDVVGLVEKKGRERARQVVSEFHEKLHGQRLRYFPRSEEPATCGTTASSVMRYSVAKATLERLFSVPVKGRGAGERFVKLALDMITRSPQVSYDGFTSATGDSILFSSYFDWTARLAEFGIASLLFLWLHWRQAEAGSRLRLTDQDVAAALGVDRRTIQNHKQLLVERGYLRVEPADEKSSRWSAQYDPRKDGNT
jgi:hypothetical protein